MAWVPRSVFQSGLESCTNGASSNLLWKQDKVFTKKRPGSQTKDVNAICLLIYKYF